MMNLTYQQARIHLRKSAFEYNECVAKIYTHGKKKKTWFLIKKNPRILQLAMNIASGSGSPSVVLGQAASTSLRNLSEMHILSAF